MLIPSIDLMNQCAVQLERGKTLKLEHPNPSELAQTFGRIGEIAVIDLDAALGKGANRSLIYKLCEIAPCRVGGGIRSVDDAAEIIARGAVRIIVGTAVFDRHSVNHDFLAHLQRRIGRHRIMVALDVSGDKIVTHGWRTHTELTPENVLSQIEPYVGGILFTLVDREGTLQGTDLERINLLCQLTSCRVTVAGGIRSLDEVKALSRMGVDVQLGMALYTGRIPLLDGFLASLKWTGDLIPTVACDPYDRILMLGWSSAESIQKTLETGTLWFWSRSRKRLWQKGETSGHYLKFMAFRPDCDADVLKAIVEPMGPVCHTQDPTCFGDLSFQWADLNTIIHHRLKNPDPASYTASLSIEDIKKKLMEEMEELIISNDRGNQIWEIADVVYFLTVYMARNNIQLKDIYYELRRRHFSPKQRK